jgi:hypothetical protein
VSRFFAGRSASIDVVIRLTRELKLKFEDVCRPLDEDLLDRLMREGAIILHGDAVLVTTDPARLLAAHVPGASALGAAHRRGEAEVKRVTTASPSLSASLGRCVEDVGAPHQHRSPLPFRGGRRNGSRDSGDALIT